MKAVLISIKPKECELIASGKKTIEILKTYPKLETPFKVYICQALPKHGDINDIDGKVIGEFICNEIEEFAADYRMDTEQAERIADLACIKMSELMEYGYYSDCFFAWHISNIKIYDKPKALSEFKKPCISPEMPYCPACNFGYVHSREIEGEFYRVEWWCLNRIKKPPQSWRYVESIQEVEE